MKINIELSEQECINLTKELSGRNSSSCIPPPPPPPFLFLRYIGESPTMDKTLIYHGLKSDWDSPCSQVVLIMGIGELPKKGF